MTIHEQYETMNEAEKTAFTLGRASVLDDFDAICKADAFMGFTEQEWSSIKRFFDFNNLVTGRN